MKLQPEDRLIVILGILLLIALLLAAQTEKAVNWGRAVESLLADPDNPVIGRDNRTPVRQKAIKHEN